ncbi:MAG: NapC/NirT family cytochrome c [Rhodospirillales bacterium]|nr:NapC/NirT family cytochrome c [Rhodospirillales bacterium]
MFLSKFFTGRPVLVTLAIVIVAVMIGVLVAFEPVTRSFVAQDTTCLTCHEDSEYNAASTVLWDGFKPLTRPHKATPEGGQATCVSCHVPEGMLGSAYFYTHVLTLTDFFGRVHEPIADRQQAPWVPPVARRAFVARDGFLENDSSPCRSCHIEAEIKPKRKRGQKAHKNALKNKETCITCHDNLVHREVPPRDEFLKDAGTKGG